MSMDDPGKHEPVRVYESEATDDRFLIYGTAEGAQVELRFDGDALWMTQAQIADLFGRDVSVISRHIANVIEDGELGSSPDLHFLQIKGPANRAVTAYSLDMVISVGYRVSSAQATLFRRWATAVLIRFATQGFVVDVARMKAAGEQDRIRELREIVRDIRSEEANLYAEIRAICALCQDYDPASDAWRTFYRNTQAKFCFAVTSHTPAEVLMARADAAAPDMGLQTWKGERVTASDVTVAKNFLTPMEVRELNRLTDILLSIFEDQLEIGRLTTMAEATALLDAQLKNLGRVVLTGGGRVAKDQADRHARLAYKIYDDARKADERSRVEREYAQ
ncbi:MAG: RhuM family protein, partial [Brevundimonas sp.]